ncbi:MAG: hypothetical protein NTW19_21760 [Planctomycetota bacterium]|nr:hypothetical protein [Planctomycetota bacterium]
MPTLDAASRRTLLRIRVILALFVAGLVVSGLTAFPLEAEVRWLAGMFGSDDPSALARWLRTVRDGLADTNQRYPFLAYGTDWLAFAHLVIAVVFWGPIRDPVRNVWVIHFGLIACAAVVPLALVAGEVRGIPLGWRLIDCSFGLFGSLPLMLAWRWTKALERGTAAASDGSARRD